MLRPLTALLFVALLALSACSGAQQEADAQHASLDPDGIPKTFCVGVEGKTYGAGISEMSVVSVSDIVADPASFDGKTVRVEGMVTDVCPKRGCWFEIAGENPGEKLRFKVIDGEMVFPMESKGEYAVAQGTVVVDELSLEETRARLQHHAEEMGEEFDPASVTEGEMMFRIQGTGAVIGERM